MRNDAGQRFAPQPGVDAEKREPGVGAAAIEREQLEVILEHHRHMAGALGANGRQPAEQEVRHAHALIAIAAPAPAALVLQQKVALCQRRMGGAGLKLRAQMKGRVKVQRIGRLGQAGLRTDHNRWRRLSAR